MFSLFASVKSATVSGIDGFIVTVETDVSGGLPGLEIVGMADTSVREARQRVRSAIRNSGFDIPPRRITVNLAPAGLHKEGTQMDLAVATAILLASGQLAEGPRTRDYAFLGELALDGSIRPVPGVLAMVLSAMESGLKGAVIPRENQAEVSFLGGIDIRIARSLDETVGFVKGQADLTGPSHTGNGAVVPPQGYVDFREIRGQRAAKRALEVSGAGGHNILMSGPPGAGKSLLARAIPGIMPDLTPEEALVVTKIWSVAGALPPGTGLLTSRPYRAPHHTVTMAALIGGGANPRPGEITLAHRGVLFLDELPQFSPSVLNALRQPLEEGVVHVTRTRGTWTFPCRFLLVAAMNPCPCGFHGSDIQDCACTEHQRKQYISRVNGPLLDRIDICIDVQRVDVSELTGASTEEPSSAVKERVTAARERQRKRLQGTGLLTNAETGPKELSTLLNLSGAARKLLLDAYKRMKLSARAYYRVMKVAASIADLADSPRIEEEHVAEALSYRQRIFES
ncbi:MAG: YifB family Mg chelatase-like AAA ATPase [Candidatus Fermentithermobacillus carboniphilus]|uniref:YifB family Mg chelatase-like AAA ATPase n=1 Tax=Candidatus Fermentithermobacillus carboniphilus TaxID=3085328 RepID=A0AAT9LDV8_9FIRM|nr:MAG: YifB family Mg chelatase-like AAA ATPase [Candidatus Fermentithermobacillus carboniphilus]